MPISFLLSGHSQAKEKNENARRKIREAQELYDSSKESLEREQEITKESLYRLGCAKKETLNGTLRRFWKSYERFKAFKVNTSRGIDESFNLSISTQERKELEELSNIYTRSISTGVATTTSALMSFAASGIIPAMGASVLLSPVISSLVLVAPPAFFISGIAANLKADENLEKAKKALAEAKQASEKMKISRLLCEAITERSDMFWELLIMLETVLENFTAKMEDLLDELELDGCNTIKVDEEDLTDREVEMVGAAASLAHAVKSIIDTPILTENCELSSKSFKVYNTAKNKLEKYTDINLKK